MTTRGRTGMLRSGREFRGIVATALLLAAAMLGVAAGPAAAYLHMGKATRYPAEGGKWEYGFWNTKVRSLYTHDSVTHGSSVKLNGDLTRSICTAKGHKSVAEAWALNSPGATDSYYYRIC